MEKLLPFVFFLIGCLSFASPYPISPRPLRLLVSESEHIVFGHVVKIEVKDLIRKKKVYDTKTTAVIVVKERLQGTITEDTIRIDFRPNMICPASDMYYENFNVLAFLDGKNGNYSTHALSYGSKTLIEAEDYSIYKQRIVEMQLILKNPDKITQLKETIEWFVKCAENDITRWEGTYELSPQSDFMSMYSKEKFTNYEILLSKEQKQRLKGSLLQSAGTPYFDLGLLDLVYLGNEDELDVVLLCQLKEVIDDTEYWTILDYMQRLVHLNDSDAANSCIAQMTKYMDDYLARNKNQEEMNAIRLKFIGLVENPQKN